MKVMCKSCKVKKEETEFYKEKRKVNGLASNCKECLRKYYKKWRQKNPNKIKQYRGKGYYIRKRNSRYVAYHNGRILKPCKTRKIAETIIAKAKLRDLKLKKEKEQINKSKEQYYEEYYEKLQTRY